MSIKIKSTTFIDLTQEELGIILFCRQLNFIPTKRGIIFLKRIKHEFPFGSCNLINQHGEPWRFTKAIADDLIKLPQELSVNKPTT